MKIGIFGASGLIGHELFRFYRHNNIDVIGTCHNECRADLLPFDISVDDDFSIFNGCHVVVVAGGITNIDRCKSENKLAYSINVEKTINLLSYFVEKGIKPVFLSTDNVFNGRQGNYCETDPVNPINAYGEFKAAIEAFISTNFTDYLIARLAKNYARSFLYDTIFSELIKSFISNQRVCLAYNQIFNPTEVCETVLFLSQLIRFDASGLYHVADGQQISRYEFGARLAQKYGFKESLIRKIKIEELSLVDQRPCDVSLNVRKMQAFMLSLAKERQE